ncbi:MarR family transcriptional regulator [Azospirillum thermophilum]|uniref:MarR family transcriptional regulator n=1 Tax=Azospirillum thermophilum TaxID=2202148 RepID=A0A2S2CL65_9PROT|nr:MarR family transcriptional regulator [Azospirillum thermophilum]AWK85169.1 MarR family transcriptional regulator [Azospirillum thermophilum]
MPDESRQQVLSSIGILLQETARAWRLKLDQRLRPLGLSQAKWRALVLTDRAGDGVTQKELAELMGIEGPTLVRLLDRLEEDGWLERRVCPQDRRSRRIHLSAQARDMLARIEAVAAELRVELLGGLAEDDLRTLDRLLRDIRRRVGDAR